MSKLQPPQKCQGSDCPRTPTTENLRRCNKCGKWICWWCLAHCNPSHECNTPEGK